MASDRSTKKRYEAIKRFKDPVDDSQILIASMTLKLVGFATQKTCHRVFSVKQPYNLATDRNAVMRVRRRGQDHVQKVTRYYMPRMWRLLQEEALRSKHEDLVNVA